MNAAMPPLAWASAMMCRQTVVLPEPSGPKTSMMRPRGMPPDAERDVERERPGGDDRHAGSHRVLAELHDGALAELLLDLLERDVEHLVAVHPALLLPGPLAPRPTGEEVPGELVSCWNAHATERV